jgi:hypothetical protein
MNNSFITPPSSPSYKMMPKAPVKALRVVGQHVEAPVVATRLVFLDPVGLF